MPRASKVLGPRKHKLNAPSPCGPKDSQKTEFTTEKLRSRRRMSVVGYKATLRQIAVSVRFDLESRHPNRQSA